MSAYGRRIGKHTRHAVLSLHCRCNFRNFILICVVIQQDNCVVFWENVGDRILFSQRVDGFCAVLQIARADKQHHKQNGNHLTETIAEFAQRSCEALFIRVPCPLSLLGLFNQPVRHQDECRQNREHTKHAERNALRQHNADIRADLKAHKDEHQKSDDGGDGAAGN